MTNQRQALLTLSVLSLSLMLGTAYADEPSEGSTCNTLLMGKSISGDWLDQQLARVANQHPAMTRLQTAVRQTGLQPVSVNEEIIKNHNSSYTYILKGQGVTEQHQTGRCWVFSAQSVMRSSLLTSGMLPPNFEISENYVWFYSLLERSNHFIENLMKLTHRKLSAREVQVAAVPRISEGGLFHDFVEIVNKYGVVPKAAMPETSGSLRSGVTSELELMLSDFALKWNEEKRLVDVLRQQNGGALTAVERLRVEEELRAKKDEVMKGVFQILITHLGVPPKEFNLRVTGKPSKRQIVGLMMAGVNPNGVSVGDALDVKMTPMELLELTGFQKEEWVTVTHRPMKEFGRRYQLQDSYEVTPEGTEKPKMLQLYNLPMSRLIELTERTLLEGYPVEFDSNVGVQMEFGRGIMHPELFDTDPVYGDLVNRKKLLESRQNLSYLFKNQANHAMAIVGVDRPDPSQPAIKFLVQNSWGPTKGEGGYLHMYREWMEKYLENINIPKRFLTPQELKAFERPAIQVTDYGSLYRK